MNSVQAHNWLSSMQQGSQEFKQGKLSAAVRCFDAATKSLPSRVEGWLNLGIVQVKNGAPEPGLISLEIAIGLNPGIMLAHMAVGDAHRQLLNWPEATAAYQRAVNLQRTPMSLNQLAGALRVARSATDAEKLYREALQMEPGFGLAKVNLATVQVELQKFEEARALLSDLDRRRLSRSERDEAAGTNLALDLYFHVQPGLEPLMKYGDFKPLSQVLCEVPDSMLKTDPEILDGIRRYARSASRLPLSEETSSMPLPEDWPLIEGLFMIPLVDGVAEYRQVRNNLAAETGPTGDLLESVNMDAVVRAARAAGDVLQDPITAEMHLRHWYALALNNVPNTTPGHFKMTRNMVHKSVMEYAQPHLVTGSLRSFFSNTYKEVSPGLPRGLVAFMAIIDIHPFEDANGRLGLSLLNRELEWAGQMPVLFTRKLGFGAQLSAAIKAVRQNNGDVAELIPVIRKGQQFARDFCTELAQT